MQPVFVISLVLLWIIVLFNLLLTFGLVRRVNARPTMPAVETLRIGEVAPEFTAKSLDGQVVMPDDYEGRSLALIFMSPTCMPCLEKLPELELLAPKARKNGVEFVLVYKTSLAETRDFVTKQGITLPVLVDGNESDLWQSYMVAGTPFYCLVDEERKVLSTGLFGPDWDHIAKNWS